MHTLHIHHRPSHIGLISLTVGCRDEIKPKDQKVVEALIAKSLGGKGAASAAAAAGGKKGKGKRGAEAEAGKGKKKAKAEPTSPEDKQFAKDKAKYDKEMEYQWRIKNNLSQHCSKKELQLLLEHNGLPFKGAGAGGEQDLQRNAKEALCYGVALSPGAAGGCCDKATTLRYDPAQHKYVCGQLSDWGSCLYTSPADETHMDALEIPPSLAEHSYLGKFKFKFRERLRKPIDPSENLEQLKLQAVAAKYKAGSKAQKDALKLASQSVAGAPFADLVFCLATKDKDLAEKIEKLGGVIKSSVTKNCTHLIATETEYTEKAGKHAKMMKAAAALDTCKVVEAEWVDRTFEAKARKDEYNYRLDLSAEQKAERDERQSTWGRKKRKHGETQKLIIKGRSAVDPDAGEEHQRYMHVLDEGDRGVPAIWDFMGNVADAHNNSNSFYGIQLLESDDKRRRRWFVFRKWGRVGTDIGNTRDEEFGSVDEAKARFEELYLDKTGNAWQSILDGATFTKKPGKHFPVDRALDAGDAGDSSKLATVKADARSKLDARVQDLMCLIFDVKLMEDSLREMEIDLKKMPLGQLKKSQIKSGYEVLSRIQEVLENEGLGAAARKQQLSDLSNHFYTVIPHDFGLGRIKIIESTDDLRAKITMIEALLDIEAAVTMLGGGDDDGASGPTAEVDKHYAKLHCDLKPVEKKSEAYKQLQKYVMNGARKSNPLTVVRSVPFLGLIELGVSAQAGRPLAWHRTRSSPGCRSRTSSRLSARARPNASSRRSRSATAGCCGTAPELPTSAASCTKACESRRPKRRRRAIGSARGRISRTSSASPRATAAPRALTKSSSWRATWPSARSGRPSATSTWTRRSRARSAPTRWGGTSRCRRGWSTTAAAACCPWARCRRPRSARRPSTSTSSSSVSPATIECAHCCWSVHF